WMIVLVLVLPATTAQASGAQTYVIEPQYEFASEFSEGLASIQIDGKVGVIDRSGKVIVQPKYDRVHPFIEGFATVELNGRYGFIDREGNEITSPRYDYAVNFFYRGLSW